MRDQCEILAGSSCTAHSSVRSTGGSALGCSSTQDLSMPYWSCVQLKKLATKDRPVDSKDNPDPDPWRLPPRLAATTMLRTPTSHAAQPRRITRCALGPGCTFKCCVVPLEDLTQRTRLRHVTHLSQATTDNSSSTAPYGHSRLRQLPKPTQAQ